MRQPDGMGRTTLRSRRTAPSAHSDARIYRPRMLDNASKSNGHRSAVAWSYSRFDGDRSSLSVNLIALPIEVKSNIWLAAESGQTGSSAGSSAYVLDMKILKSLPDRLWVASAETASSMIWIGLECRSHSTAHFARFDLRNVEHIVNNPEQVLGIASGSNRSAFCHALRVLDHSPSHS